MLRIKQFFTLTYLTAIEVIRQPICLLLATACIVSIALVPLVLMHNFGEDGKLVRDSGLALHFFFGVFIAGYAAGSSVSHEIKRGTASVVLSKPVSRDLFFLAKFSGIVGVILLFSLCAGITTLLSERVAEKFILSGRYTGYITDWWLGRLLIAVPLLAYLSAGFFNYTFKKPFESTAFILLFLFLIILFLISGFFDRSGYFSPYNFRVQWRITTVSVLIIMALIVFASIAITLSLKMESVYTLVFCGLILLIGLMSDFIFGRYAQDSIWADIVYRVIPNWQHFWIPDALSNVESIPCKYIINAGLYASIYTIGILCIGVLLFRHSEMK